MKVSNKFIKISQYVVVLGAILALSFTIMIIVNNNKTHIQINGKKIYVEIASTAKDRESGLSGITKLADNRGMLFQFSDYGNQQFWNNNLLIPLDIIWINDNTVVGIDKLPIESQEKVIVISPQKVNNVLEINSGVADKLNIKKGDIIKLNNAKR